MDKLIELGLDGHLTALPSINHTAPLERLKLLTNVLSHRPGQLICSITNGFLLEALEGLVEHLPVQLLEETIVRYRRISYLLGYSVAIEL